MSVGLFASDTIPIHDIANALKADCRDAIAITLAQGVSIRHSVSVRIAVLVVPGGGIVSIGESISKVRELINTTPLLVCAQQPTGADRKLLEECGATRIVTPRSWAAAHIVERILAELILEGFVRPSSSGPIFGGTQAMRKLYADIGTVAPIPDPVLIVGESGSGKELVAKEVHRLSGVSGKILAVDCGTLTPELAGAELFGHTQGAFTNANRPREGLLIAAGSGTIFLDEIGNLSLQAQANLLRVLDEKKVRPIGSNKAVDFAARIVLATNRDLQEDCLAGRFRSDLHERIRGFTLYLPPLRERRADIPILGSHFLEEFNTELSKELEMPAGGLDCLFRHDWPGNVRELRNAIRRAAAYADPSGSISVMTLQESARARQINCPDHTIQFDPSLETWHEVSRRVADRYFRAVLAEARGQKQIAAKLAGLSRSQFYEKLKEIETSALGEDSQDTNL